ncbi:MAG: GIY-YIG nuclease family protein [Devosia sp.]|uniref:GIY-YIG nuclease family protein n=1 Tax=Devosia sp. TaxID=1871048 RepID=UPI0024C9EA36|nr:GIY-YIG nuclease family protein [Devosia sp.]UYO00749.1 MAG: GIY-YIG nuclease family protein [Devosia sp.]
MSSSYFVYILASRKFGALYIGVTRDLLQRVQIHRDELLPGHTTRYHIHLLVHFEVFDDPERAILREKQLKKWRRSWKIDLIETANPAWDDLYPGLFSTGENQRFPLSRE